MAAKTLTGYLTEVRDTVDLQPTAKYTDAILTRFINKAKNVLAQETGFLMTRQQIAISNLTQFTALPTNLCWGIQSLNIGVEPVELSDVKTMDENTPGWRYASDFPNQPNNDCIEILSTDNADTVNVTIQGTTYATNVYATETKALTGTTAASTIKLTWGEVWYVTLAAVCTGTITVREKSTSQTITTILPGDLSSGTEITSSRPGKGIVNHPNIEWDVLPDASYTATMFAGTLPADLTGTDTITGLPSQFEYVIVDGAALLTEQADLYAEPQMGRAQSLYNSFWQGVKSLKIYLNNISRNSGSSIPITNRY